MADEEKVFCQSCGKAIQKDASFCTYCGASVPGLAPRADPGKSATKLCYSCRRSYASEYTFCPYCGTYFVTGAYGPQTDDHQAYTEYKREPLGAIKYVAWLVAFLLPIAGVIWGIIWMMDKDEEKKDAGKITLIIGIVAWLLNFICLLFIGF